MPCFFTSFRSTMTLALSLPVAVLSFSAQADVTTSPAASSQEKPAKPNVIMIYTDDMGYGDLSSFSDALPVKTPHIDRMAKEGRKFTQFYVSMPICSPSRAAVLSGTFSPENQLTNYLQTREGNYQSDQNDYMDPARAYLPKSFQAAGYATGHIGKWHLGGGRDVDNAPTILKYGYDEAYSTWESPMVNHDPKLGIHFAPWDRNHKDPGQVERYDRTRYMVDKTLDFLKRHKDKPCFITLWPDDLHTPYRPSPAMRKKYGGKPGADNGVKNFYAVLEEYDRQMGRLLDGLKDIGAEENTILFFTGDNGPAPTYEHTRTDGMRGMKLSLYEGGIREPFIIRWPGKIQPDTTDNETIMSTIDLLPTLTSMAGIPMVAEAKDKFEGQDMSGAILGPVTAVKRVKPLMWEYGRTPHVPRPKADSIDLSPKLAIRDGDFKLLVNDDNTSHELYNLRNDRKEKANLAGKPEHKELIEKLSRQVIEWQKTLPHRTQPYPAVKP